MFVERVWRTIKYERVYLRACDSVNVARKDIAQYIDWYNRECGHSSIDDKTLEQFYLSGLPAMKKAA